MVADPSFEEMGIPSFDELDIEEEDKLILFVLISEILDGIIWHYNPFYKHICVSPTVQ